MPKDLDLDFDDPADTPHLMSVPCYNTKDGCTNKVQYMGAKPVPKLCIFCLETGAPSERRSLGFNFDKMRRAAQTIPEGGYHNYGGEPVYAVTAWPKTFFDGRVRPCMTEW